MKAAEWDARYVQSDLVWGAPPNNTVVEFVHGLDRRVPRLPGPDWEIPDLPRALDLACGEGRNALWLATHGWRVHGVDFSQVGIDKGRTVATRLTRSIRERITWECADLADPALDLGGPWELILLVFLHLPAPERRRLLRQAATALAPGGMLLVLGHHSENPARGYGGPQDPAILFTPEDVVADLGTDSGLEIDTAREVLRPTESGDAIDALVVARKPMPEQ
ncbi:class I SAM-dependent methyltransferase [Nocardia sp. NPDC002869]|uniref:class I SAM-dependent methyltransferase n=1 Tax=Nocardia sp. NPDC002869 TaxID=3161032 RepID=UPI00398CA59D